MLKWTMESLLRRRAAEIVRGLAPHLRPAGQVLDIGCGTGHNAAALRTRLPGLEVTEADVADLKCVGGAPILFDGLHLPFGNRQFDDGLMLFVLQYCEDAAGLLAEARRVMRRRLLVWQGTWRGGGARAALAVREYVQGRGAFRAARGCGLIRTLGCPLLPRTYYRREPLEALFATAGWRVACCLPKEPPWPGLSRDLYVLARD
jgi:SAM-dependent methyltransferase